MSTEIEPQGDAAKSVRLDVALKLANGTLIDLEMQTSRRAGYLRRCVFYNGALLVAHTKMGASHHKKSPQVLLIENRHVQRKSQPRKFPKVQRHKIRNSAKKKNLNPT